MIKALVLIAGEAPNGEDSPVLEVYPFPDREAALAFAERSERVDRAFHRVTGGYPDTVRVVDLEDPSTMDDIREHLSFMDDMETAEPLAEMLANPPE